jgi:excisionase family DNA binding protein
MMTPRGNKILSDEPLMTVEELKIHLRISARAIYDWVAAGKIPCVRLGNRIRFIPSEVNRWLEGQRQS